MQEIVLNDELVGKFIKQLEEEEKSINTINKYIHDIKLFKEFLNEDEISKEKTIAFKKFLLEKKYAVRSINSMLTSINTLLSYLGLMECKVKCLKWQKQVYYSSDKELSKSEYVRLVKSAKKNKNERLSLILQTICTTGIRVSELQYITVEAVRRGEAVVSLKGKIRYVLIINNLQKKLLRYIERHNIESGIVFKTRSGRSINRTNVWKEMKDLCKLADVLPSKVYPHNLRHLFARTFYEIEKDIAKLADILGHSSIETTRIYIITTSYEHRRCMESMRLLI